MPTIYAHTGDANMRMNNEASWAAARGASSAEVIDTSADKYAAAVREKANAAGTQYTIRRYFTSFDTSCITNKPQSANINLYGYINTDSQIVVVKVSAGATGDSSTDFVAADYNNVTLTNYSAEFTSTFSTSGYNTITLNDDALNDMVSLDEFKIAVVGHDFDYSNSTPPNSTSRATGFYTANAADVNQRPALRYIAAASDSGGGDEEEKRFKVRPFGGTTRGFSVSRVAAPPSGGKVVSNGFRKDGF